MSRKDHYPDTKYWREALEAVRKRLAKYNIFEGIGGLGGGYYVKQESRAWCCAPFTPSASRSQGPQKVKAHIRTVNHFREWCIEHKSEALERFPEVKPLFAEFELTYVDPRTKAGLSSTTSIDMAGGK